MPALSDYAALLVVPYGVYLICKGLFLLGLVYVLHETVMVLGKALKEMTKSLKEWPDEEDT